MLKKKKWNTFSVNKIVTNITFLVENKRHLLRATTVGGDFSPLTDFPVPVVVDIWRALPNRKMKYCIPHSELPGIIYSRSSPGPGHFSLDMGYLSYVC